MKSALVDRRLAEKAERHLIRAFVLARESDARRERYLPADDAVPAEKIYIRIEHVHRAAFARGAATGTTIKLGHDLVRRHPLGDGVAVLAITGQHVIIRAECGESAH